MNIFVLLGTVVTSTVASAFSVLQQPVEPMELRRLVIETRVPELDTSLHDIPPESDIGTAQLISGVTPTNIPLSPAVTPLQPSPTAAPIPTESGPTIKQTSPTPTNTPSPTPTSTFITSLISTTPAAPPPHSLNSDTILSLINAHRTTKGLPALEKEDRLCALAQSRGPELYNEIFVTKNVHAGFYSRKLPYWITENMAHYGSEEAIVNWWLGSPIHRRAIEGNYKYSCGTCFGNSCNQLFTNYTPK